MNIAQATISGTRIRLDKVTRMSFAAARRQPMEMAVNAVASRPATSCRPVGDS